MAATGLPPSMESGSFGRGSFSRAHGDRARPDICHLVTEVDANPMTLGNALSNILHAPPDASIRIVTHEDALVAVVTQSRGLPLSKATGPIPMEVLRTLLRCVLAELASLHAAGRAHTDVKPANIIYCSTSTEGGRYRLIDQGSMHDVVLCARPVYHPTLLTTPDYRPPWIGEGANDAPVDASKLDMWSLGATVLSLLTGESFCALPSEPSVSPSFDDLYEGMARDASKRCSYVRSLLSLRSAKRSDRIACLVRLVPALEAEPDLAMLLSRMLEPREQDVISAVDALHTSDFLVSPRPRVGQKRCFAEASGRSEASSRATRPRGGTVGGRTV